MIDRFQELEPVAERIEEVETIESLERLIRNRFEAGGPASGSQFRQAADHERRVSLTRGTEFRFDTQVQSHGPVAEPDAATMREIRRLCLFGESQDV
jgi:hypothetical protein